jgi:hypothetical protein
MQNSSVSYRDEPVPKKTSCPVIGEAVRANEARPIVRTSAGRGARPVEAADNACRVDMGHSW